MSTSLQVPCTHRWFTHIHVYQNSPAELGACESCPPDISSWISPRYLNTSKPKAHSGLILVPLLDGFFRWLCPCPVCYQARHLKAASLVPPFSFNLSSTNPVIVKLQISLKCIYFRTPPMPQLQLKLLVRLFWTTSIGFSSNPVPWTLTTLFLH